MIRCRLIAYSLIFTLIIGLLASCTAALIPTTSSSPWPIEDWRTSTPEEHGLDSALILAMLQEIQNQRLSVHSVLIIRHGYLVTEVYYPPYQQETLHPIFSTTKSVTSLLVGKALQKGYLKSIQQKVLDFFPDIAREVTDPQVQDLTIEHLLTMSAGFNTNTLPDLNSKAASAGTIKHILTYDSILVKPGTLFYYDSGLPHLLSAIVQKATGVTLQEYAQQKLFEPLGITDVTWQADPQGVTLGNTGLCLRPRDLAKIGYLYLHQGQWNGTQVVPADWVRASTTKHMETQGLMDPAEDDGYGYLWWIDRWGGYSAHGFGGQYTFVIPSLDMVIVVTSGLPDSLFPLPNQLVKDYLIPAAQTADRLPPNPTADQNLENYIRQIEQPDRPVAPLPDIAQSISGKTFQLTQTYPTRAWFQAITFTFAGGDTYQSQTLWPGNQTVCVTGGLNHVFHFTPVTFKNPQLTGDLLVAIRGYWQNDHTFVEEYARDLNAEIALVTQKSTFTGDQVTIESSSNMDPFIFRAVGEIVK